MHFMTNYQEKPGIVKRIFRVLAVCGVAFLFVQLISLYLSWQKQAVLGAVSILLALAINRFSKARVVTLALMLISITATFRYGWWRIHQLVDYFSDPSNHRVSIDAAFMLLLISSEVYTVLIMILGYMQTAWPLERKPIPMPADETRWPDVDVLIPTYNEPLSLVRYTALAAINMDYPPDRLHVHVLDDGTREDFKNFCAEAGVGYVTRPIHSHAKAGNINHALETMDSPFVAIFDCDHVPTRSFLQMTVGWMLADKKLAMLQTPHHFYSPDPFERNLLQYKTIPNEGELFYGIVQDGNDFWNATFFCGSCALIRRAALDEVGGIATETVTEDAHTSLRMQRHGYNTAYINIPQAAGLATETLAAHVGQRIRWARGMIQILRTDNPLFGPGLTLPQRLCYFNAMAHFMYAVPRLVFLLAPLVYLLLGRTIIPGYWVAILAYAFPHLILASLTNSRIQGRHRHSFWNEIYESVLAPYILAPTLLALINPKLGKFNVTAKGNTLEQTQFDRKISAPTRWMLFLNFLGILAIPYRLVADPGHPGAVFMNLLWVLFDIVILGVAAAVAHEQKQRRESVRIEAKIAVRLEAPDGRTIDGETLDMSVGGSSIRLAGNERIVAGEMFAVSFPNVCGEEQIGGKAVAVSGNTIRLTFLTSSILEQETLTRALYSRADAWLDSAEKKEVDRPLVSLGRVVVLSGYGLYQILRSLLPEKRPAKAVSAAQTAAMFLLACVLGACGVARASGTQVQVAFDRNTNAAQRTLDSTAVAQAARNGVEAGFSPNAAPSAEVPGTARQTISFEDLSLQKAIEMHGPHSYYSVHFTLSHALVPRQATLKLLYSIDPSLDPGSTSLRVSLNNVAVTTLTPAKSQSGVTTAEIPIPDLLLVRSNILTFEFTGSGVMQSEAQARAHVLCRVFPESAMEVSGDRLRLQNDLSRLPLPIFDSDLETEMTVPFVFLALPSRNTLEAAGIVASWLGVEAGARPPRFSVSLGAIPQGNAVLVANNRSQLPPSLELPVGGGPLLALRNNPSDPYGSLLVVAGDDDAQLLTAARSLALTGKTVTADHGQGPALSGDTAQLPELTLPPARAKDDAPLWMQAGAIDPLTNCQTPDALQTDGSNPVRVYFHVPPDLFYGETQTLDMRLNYRYDARPMAAGSALRTFVNGNLVSEAPLLPGGDSADGHRLIMVPVADLRPFGNTVQFNFDFVPANRDPMQSSPLSGDIGCDSTLDLRGLDLWTRMPNLELFANAGFPFTQRADLAQTIVVLPSDPKPGEIMLYLQLMSHFGAQTAYPSLRVTVAGPSTVISPGRDYLILGTIANQPAFDALSAVLPVTFDVSGIHAKPVREFRARAASLEGAAWRWAQSLLGRQGRVTPSPAEGGMPDALVEEIESPASQDRSIVLVDLKQDDSAAAFASALVARSQSTDMIGPVSLLRNSRFRSYSLDEPTYHVGDISWYATMRIYLTQHFLLLLLTVTALSLLAAFYAYEWMAWHARERLKSAEMAHARE